MKNLIFLFIFYVSILTAYNISVYGASPKVANKNKNILSFRSSVVYGSQKNNLSIHISTDYKGGNSIEELSKAKWNDITELFELSEAPKFMSSGNIDISKYMVPGKPLFIAFKYSGQASPKPTQRMWRIQRLSYKQNGTQIKLSDWLFINDDKNDKDVGWEYITPNGIQYRSRMTVKQSESWGIVQVMFPNIKPVITGGDAPVLSLNQKNVSKAISPVSKQQDFAVVTNDELKKAMYKAYLSKGPNPETAPKPVMEILNKTKEKDHERWHVRYLVDKDEYSFAYLLLPLNMDKNVRLPLVLCPHPTSDIGKDRVIGLYKDKAKSKNEQLGRDSRQYALDLVRKGFITFAPDRAAYGERRLISGANFKDQMSAYSKKMRESHPGFGLNGKAIWDLQRALDFLVELDFVDKSNIGIIGHSLGAWDAILLSAFDERVKAAVVNSGGMLAYKPEIWSENPTALRSYLNTPSKQSLTSNVNIFLMLNAQRSVFYLFSLRDPFYKGKPQLLEAYKTVYDYYKKHNPKKRADISYFLHTDGHSFDSPAKGAAYSWLEERLLKN